MNLPSPPVPSLLTIPGQIIPYTPEINHSSLPTQAIPTSTTTTSSIMPPLGFVAARAGKKIGKGLLHTAVGAAVISGLNQLFGVKQETEIIKTEGISEMRLEKNHNMIELNMATGASSVMAIIIMAFVGLCLCGKMRKVLKNRKEEKEKEKKKEEKKKEEEKKEEEENEFQLEEI